MVALESSMVDPPTGTPPNDRSLNSGKREPVSVFVTSENSTWAEGILVGKARLYLVGISCRREEVESLGTKTGASGFKEGECIITITPKK